LPQAVARFLPRKVSRLVLAYLTLVRPLEALLCGITGGRQAEQSTMMTTLFASEGVRWTAEHYGLALEQAFVQEMNEEIGIREYRQIQAALSGYHLSKWTELFLDTDEAAFEQQGHTTTTHEREYDRVIKQSHGVSQHSQLRFELASIQWQALVFPESNKDPSDALIGLTATELPTEGSPARIEDSVLAKVPKQAGTHPTTRTPVPVSILRGLRKILNSDRATYRSNEQAQATAFMVSQTDETSQHHRKDLLVILPTGMGKTVTWLVAGALGRPESLTIVIVPLNALLLDLSSRLVTYGQEVHQQDPRGKVDLEGRRGCFLISVDRIVQDDAVKEIHRCEDRIVSTFRRISTITS
jgi:hypothetical protein